MRYDSISSPFIHESFYLVVPACARAHLQKATDSNNKVYFVSVYVEFYCNNLCIASNQCEEINNIGLCFASFVCRFVGIHQMALTITLCAVVCADDLHHPTVLYVSNG